MPARHALPLILLFLIGAPVRADSMMPEMMAMHARMAASRPAPCGVGTVLRVDVPIGRLIIRHRELDGLGMPAMTTAFKVRDKSLMKGIKAGDQVGFQVEPSEDGLVVTALIRDKWLDPGTPSVREDMSVAKSGCTERRN
jgi:Cu(I)/Ag(I) efflux system protein CusF